MARPRPRLSMAVAERTPVRRIPLAAPLPDDVPETAPQPPAPRPAKAPRPILAPKLAIPPGRRRRAVLLGAVLIAWAGFVAAGGLRPVVVIAPLEVRGSLGRNAAGGMRIEHQLRDTILTVRREAATPILELWIGAGPLDGSSPNYEEPRLLPAVQPGKVQYVVPWRSADAWGRDMAAVDAIVGACRQLGWTLTGRRTHRLSGSLLPAQGR
ncbi:MAG TPA: hypothetical protein VEI97_12280, partial [bacterium]|nr:hypothetical protein [bacterium]